MKNVDIYSIIALAWAIVIVIGFATASTDDFNDALLVQSQSDDCHLAEVFNQ